MGNEGQNKNDNHIIPILQTKIRIPSLSSRILPRIILTNKLKEIKDIKLTIISAPAGYGKTTLLYNWLANSVKNAAWYSIGESDDDFNPFLTYLIHAIRTINPGIGEGILNLINTPQQLSFKLILSRLITEINEFNREFILVLEDYHFIKSKQIHDSLRFLIDNLPEKMHLVISSRSDPPIPLARLRSQNLMREIRVSDLRFTKDDIYSFFSDIPELKLSDKEISLLQSRTEGWITGLQLVKLTIEKKSDFDNIIDNLGANNHYITDYLIEEVLNRQSDFTRKFLLEASILNQLFSSVCNAVCCIDNSEVILKDLERKDLFLFSQDDECKYYRFHSLFARLLQNSLKNKDPKLFITLHKRASQWYMNNGFTYEAYNHELTVNDYAEATLIIKEEVEALWKIGAHNKMHSLISKLPVEYILPYPNLCIYYAWALMAMGKPQKTIQLLAETEDQITNSISVNYIHLQDLAESERLDLIGKIASIRAALSFFEEKTDLLINLSQYALKNLSNSNLIWKGLTFLFLGDGHTLEGDISKATEAYSNAIKISKEVNNLYFTLIANIKSAVNLKYRGELDSVIQKCNEINELTKLHGIAASAFSGVSYTILGECLYEMNDIENAKRYVEKGITLTSQDSDITMLAWSFHCFFRVMLYSNNIANVENSFSNLEIIFKETFPPPWAVSLINNWKVKLHILKEDLNSAKLYLDRDKLVSDKLGEISSVMEFIVYSRYLIAAKKYEEAYTILNRLNESKDGLSHVVRTLEVRILNSIVLFKLNRQDEGIEMVCNALKKAESLGFLNIFIDEGIEFARLLSATLDKINKKKIKVDISINYLKKLLFLFGKKYNIASFNSNVESLSQREIDVLLLIAEGFSNQEIADRLFVSLNTIRTHNKSIFIKLDVHSRVQAITVASDLGFI